MDPVITVYTSVVGNRDGLRDDQTAEGADFVAFVDRPWGSTVWTERPAFDRFISARRNARAPKILAHQFIESRYSLWMDGRVALRVPAARLVAEWLSHHDLAIFRHPKRNCIYAAANECARRELDDPAVIGEQVTRYREAGFGEGQGLAESCIVLRRHTAAVEEFNNCWWSELCRHSVRDQISFMYAVAKSALPIKLVDFDIARHPYFDLWRRPAAAEPRPPPPRAIG